MTVDIDWDELTGASLKGWSNLVGKWFFAMEYDEESGRREMTYSGQIVGQVGKEVYVLDYQSGLMPAWGLASLQDMIRQEFRLYPSKEKWQHDIEILGL